MCVFVYVRCLRKSGEFTNSSEILLASEPTLAVRQWTGHLVTLPKFFPL